MNSPDNERGFLLDHAGITISRINPRPGEYLIIPDAPLDPNPASRPTPHRAIIDSGVMNHHPQLRGLVAAERDFTGEGPEDRIGHGTVVALIAVASQYRVAQPLPASFSEPRISLLSAKVADSQGRIKKQHVIEAIRWAAEQGARVVNLSLGFRGRPDQHRDLCAAISDCEEVFFVAAAGNFGPSVTLYPAGCAAGNLISVGAIDAAGQVAGYSGQGDVYAVGDVYLTLARVDDPDR